jgi:hypothetical protein
VALEVAKEDSVEEAAACELQRTKVERRVRIDQWESSEGWVLINWNQVKDGYGLIKRVGID